MTPLTRAEIMALTPEQLRLQVAELMGWKWVDAPLIKGRRYLRRDNSSGAYAEDGAVKFITLPNFPRDIAAAWTVAEYLFEKGERVEILSHGDGWTFKLCAYNRFMDRIRKYGICGIAVTLPIAICRAALMAASERAS